MPNESDDLETIKRLADDVRWSNPEREDREEYDALIAKVTEIIDERDALAGALMEVWNPVHGEDAADTLAGVQNTAYQALKDAGYEP